MRARHTALAATAAAALVLTGCASTPLPVPVSTGSAGTPTRSEQQAADNSGLTAQQLLQQSLNAAQSAQSMHMTGHVQESGQAFTLDLRYATNGCTGTITISGNVLQVLLVGGFVYFKASDAFWKSQLPPEDQGAIAIVHGKWIKVSSDQSEFGSFQAVLDRKSFLNELTSGLSGAQVTKQGTKQVNGVTAIVLTGDPGDELDVAKSGTPYPVRIVSQGSGSPGELDFSDWNAQLTINPPPAGQVLDLSQLGG